MQLLAQGSRGAPPTTAALASAPRRAVAGEAAGLALGLLLAGSGSEHAAEMLAYAHDTQVGPGLGAGGGVGRAEGASLRPDVAERTRSAGLSLECWIPALIRRCLTHCPARAWPSLFPHSTRRSSGA